MTAGALTPAQAWCYGWMALPLLALFGDTPGWRETPAQIALTIAYGLLPCALKLAAAGLLYGYFLHRRPGDSS